MSETDSKPSSPVKTGERVIFIVTAIFLVLAIIGFGAMEYVRHHMDKPMFPVNVAYHFSDEAKQGMEFFFRKGNCTDCHRALNSGTNMGPGSDLDGMGSKHDAAWIYNFMRMPEQTYTRGATLDHGPGKAAAYVATMDAKELHAIAAFLSSLKARSGSTVSPVPPSDKSPFIDSMVRKFAPASWKTGQFKDMRKDKRVANQHGASARTSTPGEVK